MLNRVVDSSSVFSSYFLLFSPGDSSLYGKAHSKERAHADIEMIERKDMKADDAFTSGQHFQARLAKTYGERKEIYATFVSGNCSCERHCTERAREDFDLSQTHTKSTSGRDSFLFRAFRCGHYPKPSFFPFPTSIWRRGFVFVSFWIVSSSREGEASL